jgi:hypothetical protein
MSESTPAQPATTTSSGGRAEKPAKVGVLVPWLLMTAALLALFAVHVVLDPLSETIQQIDALKQATLALIPTPLQEPVGEFLSWYLALSIETPVGPLAQVLMLWLFLQLVVLRFLSTLFGALLGHLMLLATGGTAGGWRVTFRIFALNRATVELANLLLILGVIYSPLSLPLKLVLLLVGFLMIRVVGMGTLLAQVVRAQDLGVFRTVVIAAPIFGILTLLSMFLAMFSYLWVGLWCVAKVG